ncbi:unnamed protein product [Mytilus coruscus]|uniref:Uncharacterized protein n=1 Tax=Mytilus coruscus TaxID=42192 RepID=A0A6J8BU52_MYTCO|nr:unnamed protein product [Mytilus coruscus]
MSDIGYTDHAATNAHDRDAFHLFRDYLDYKLVDLKADLASEQDNLSCKFKEEVGIKFKKEGNSIQYHFNDEILTRLHKIQKKGPSLDSPTNSIVSELITKVKARNKSTRIADSSAGGWTTVREYESNTIADKSDDEKKIRQAESRAVKSIKERPNLAFLRATLATELLKLPDHLKLCRILLILSLTVVILNLHSPFVQATVGVSLPSMTCVTSVNSLDIGARTAHLTGSRHFSTTNTQGQGAQRS